jgi:hypothetical protein
VTRRADVANDIRYTICPDDPPRVADRWRAVVRGVALDEITELAPELEITVKTPAVGLYPRTVRGGLIGLVGNPGRLYPGLDLATVDIPLTVSAPGFLPRELDAVLGPVPGFPDKFKSYEFPGPIWLHREAIVVRGRAVKQIGIDPAPEGGVTITLAGVWSVFPPYNVVPDTVIEAPNLVSLHPGLYADRQKGVDGIRRRDLTLAIGEEKKLVKPAVRGDSTVRVSDRHKLVAGNLFAFEAARPDHVEYIAITKVVGASTDDQPATLTLAYPLALDHAEGTLCVRATPVAPLANNLLIRDGIPHDRVAFAAALGGISDGVVIEVEGGAATEYQTARLYRAVTDVEGFYRLPPISRVASVKLHAQRAGLTTQEPVLSPDYRRYENPFDVIFP